MAALEEALNIRSRIYLDASASTSFLLLILIAMWYYLTSQRESDFLLPPVAFRSIMVYTTKKLK